MLSVVLFSFCLDLSPFLFSSHWVSVNVTRHHGLATCLGDASLEHAFYALNRAHSATDQGLRDPVSLKTENPEVASYACPLHVSRPHSYSGLLLSLPLITIPAGFAWECVMSQLTVASFVQVLVSRDSQSTLFRVRRYNRRLSSLFVEDRHTELLIGVLAKWRNHAWA